VSATHRSEETDVARSSDPGVLVWCGARAFAAVEHEIVAAMNQIADLLGLSASGTPPGTVVWG
jgi:hypothetical protein